MLAVLLFCVWRSFRSIRPVDDGDLNFLSDFFQVLGLALTFGSMFWFPIMVSALMPGFYVFRLVGTLCLSLPIHPRIAVGLAALAVPVVGVTGMTLVTYLVSQGSIPEGEQWFVPLIILPFGMLPAVILGQFIYVR